MNHYDDNLEKKLTAIFGSVAMIAVLVNLHVVGYEASNILNAVKDIASLIVVIAVFFVANKIFRKGTDVDFPLLFEQHLKEWISQNDYLISEDFDGDGKSDIWHSIPDALATAAQLLKKNGWQSGERWGYEVLPSNNGDGKELLALQGDAGPVFALQKNFSVVKRYNNADKYALAVLLLSDRIAGKPAPVKDWKRPYTPLNMSEKEELQRLLTTQGFYSGVVDGLIGGESREAIKRFQANKNVEQTGYASNQRACSIGMDFNELLILPL